MRRKAAESARSCCRAEGARTNACRSGLAGVVDLVPDGLAGSTDAFLEEAGTVVVVPLAGELVQPLAEPGRADQAGRGAGSPASTTGPGAPERSGGDLQEALATAGLRLPDAAGAHVTARSNQRAADDRGRGGSAAVIRRH